MTRTLRLTLVAFAAAIAFSFPASAVAQGAMRVDATLAKRGKHVFNNKGCYVCHGFGRRVGSGPDLVGIMERRDHTWLRRWLTNTTEMLQSDDQAQALWEQYNRIKMPDMKLGDADVDALFHFLAQETQKARGGD